MKGRSTRDGLDSPGGWTEVEIRGEEEERRRRGEPVTEHQRLRQQEKVTVRDNQHPQARISRLQRCLCCASSRLNASSGCTGARGAVRLPLLPARGRGGSGGGGGCGGGEGPAAQLPAGDR